MFSFFQNLNSSAKSQAVAVRTAKAFHSGASSYGGRSHGGSFTGGGKWRGGIAGDGLGILLDHKRIRTNARVILHDSAQGRAIVESKADAVGHTGLRLEPTPDAGILGLTKEEAAIWGKDVGSRWALWAADKKQNRSHKMTFAQAQRLYAFFAERDNDMFVRLYYSNDRKLQNPLQFEFIDPDQIFGASFTNTYGIQFSVDGIKRDSQGREIEYDVWVLDEKNQLKHSPIRARDARTGRIFMIHGYRQEYAGQTRGFSKLQPIIQDLHDYTDFSIATIQQAINKSNFVGWVEPGDDEDAQNIFDDDLTNNGVGPAGARFNSEGEQIAAEPDIISDVLCYESPEATTGKPGAMFLQNLTKGAKIKLADSNSPSTSFDRFQKAFLTNLAAAARVPLQVVTMVFENNFSASRATLLLFQRIVEIDRLDLVVDFIGPIYEMWLSEEIAAGRIKAPGWTDPVFKNAWMKATWRGTPVPEIDPIKAAKARKENLLLGVTSVEQESQQHSGRSATDNMAENNLSYQEYEILPFTKQETIENEGAGDGDSEKDD